MPDNTPGTDVIKKGDLLLLSPSAIWLLTLLLQAIEKGAAWPDAATTARTAFVSKGEDDLDPRGYRGLAILSKLYRMWAVIRLRHTKRWIGSWATEDLFAGTGEPVGAEDAWLLTGFVIAEARLQGFDLAGGSADSWKCFDQIQLILLFLLLALSGFPKDVLRAYTTFHNQVVYLNTVAGGLGIPHRHPCGIPQGCPFSMTMLAFLMAPWARYIRHLRAIPRSLADDLMVLAIGKFCCHIFKKAFAATFSYLNCLGAKVTAKKSFTFSTSEDIREDLRHHWWTHVAARIPTIVSIRDLGGQLNVGKVLSANTLSERIAAATELLRRLEHFPWSRSAKLAIIIALIFPMAFYGCEVAPAAEMPLANFSIALAKAVNFHNHNTSNLLTFHLVNHTCIEPGAEIFYRRCNLMRRTLDKHPWVYESVSNILLHYADQGLSGAARCASDVPSDVCPPVSYGS